MASDEMKKAAEDGVKKMSPEQRKLLADALAAAEGAGAGVRAVGGQGGISRVGGGAMEPTAITGRVTHAGSVSGQDGCRVVDGSGGITMVNNFTPPGGSVQHLGVVENVRNEIPRVLHLPPGADPHRYPMIGGTTAVRHFELGDPRNPNPLSGAMAEGDRSRLEARLVAEGFSMGEGDDAEVIDAKTGEVVAEMKPGKLGERKRT